MSHGEAESAEHRRLIKALINEFTRQGLEILNASCDGYQPCPEIEGKTADVRAYKRSEEWVVIGEAKTDDDLDNEQTEEQFNVFSSLFMGAGKSQGKKVPFVIASTSGAQPKLEACLAKLGLDKKTNIYKWYF